MPWSPIRAADDHSIARPNRLRCGHRLMKHQTDAGYVDENAITLAMLDDLGIAGDQLDPGVLGGQGHRLDDSLELGKRKPFLENESPPRSTARLPRTPPGR